jgi:hypothetical protein
MGSKTAGVGAVLAAATIYTQFQHAHEVSMSTLPHNLLRRHRRVCRRVIGPTVACAFPFLRARAGSPSFDACTKIKSQFVHDAYQKYTCKHPFQKTFPTRSLFYPCVVSEAPLHIFLPSRTSYPTSITFSYDAFLSNISGTSVLCIIIS